MSLDIHPQESNIGISLYEWFWTVLLISVLLLASVADVYADPQPSTLYSGKPVCHANDQFIVIIHDSSEVVGDEIIVRRKSERETKNDCDNDTRPTDFRVARFGEAKYFFSLHKNILILDEGTGPDGRELLIIDMSTGREIWKTVYASDPEVKGTKVRLLKYIRVGTRKMCPNYNSIVKRDLTPAYVIPIEFSLTSLSARPTSHGFCITSQ